MHKLGILVLCSAAMSAAPSAADADFVFFDGSGTLTVRGTPVRARTVLYAAANDLVLFQVATSNGAVGFEGSSDMQPTINQYVLKVSAVYNGRKGFEHNSRTPADGLCELNISTNGDTIRTLKYTAKTEFGTVKLVFHWPTKAIGQSSQPPASPQ